MAHGHDTPAVKDNFYLEPARWTQGRNALFFVALVGWLACLAGFMLDKTRFFQSYLVAFAFGTSIALAAFFFVCVQYLTGSAWSVTVRRSMENIMITLPVLGLMFIPVAFGVHSLYEWSHEDVAKELAKVGKTGFLNEQAFIIRGFIYFALWSLWAWAMHRNSVKYDKERAIGRMHTASRWSAPGLFLVVVVGSLASFDWIMSLDPNWYSTMFGLYILAGGTVAFFGALTLIALAYRESGLLANSITSEHLHDLGKWLFAMSCFYTYIAFCQYLLIWYANIPEETVWYKHRFVGTWIFGAVSLIFGRFFIPFFALGPRRNKRNPAILKTMGVFVLLMHYVDLYWVMMPVWFPKGFALHWLDLATLVAVTGTMGLMFWQQLKSAAMVNVGDLRFEQGLRLENA
jgi:hypothetical protein